MGISWLVRDAQGRFAREWSIVTPSHRCSKKSPVVQSYEFVLSVDGKVVTEDVNPGPHKLVHVQDGYIVQNVSGIRVHIVTRLDGKGFDIVKCERALIHRWQVLTVSSLQWDRTLSKGDKQSISTTLLSGLLRQLKREIRIFHVSPRLRYGFPQERGPWLGREPTIPSFESCR
jgi:hypothetical protein